MGQARRIERTHLPSKTDARAMTHWVMQFSPASKAEAIKLLRASFAECPLSMRVAIIDMLMRGWPRKNDARHSPR